MQVDGRLIGVAQAIPVERRQLQHDPRAGGRIGHGAQLPFAQLGQLGVVVSFQIELDQLLGGRSARRLEQRDLVVDPLRLGLVAELALGQLRALVEEVDPLRFGAGHRDALAVIAVELLEPPRVIVDALQQLGRLGVPGDGLQRLAQRGDGVLDVARLLPPAPDLEIDGRRPLDAVGADPVRVGVDARQELQRLFVARADAHRFGEALRRRVQLLELFAQDPPEPQQEIGAPSGVAGPLQLQLVEADHRPEVAQRAVDLARRFDRLEVLGGELAGPLRVADSPFQLGEVVEEELPHLRFQLGDAGGIAGARDGGRLHLQHRHVVGGAPLLAVDVLEAGGGPDVPWIAVDRVDQIGLGPFRVSQLVDAQLGGQIEQLAGLGVVLDPLGAGLVEGDQPVVLLRLTVGFPQRDERFGVCRIPLEGGFVFSDGGHAREPQISAKRQADGLGEGHTLARVPSRNQAAENRANRPIRKAFVARAAPGRSALRHAQTISPPGRRFPDRRPGSPRRHSRWRSQSTRCSRCCRRRSRRQRGCSRSRRRACSDGRRRRSRRR